MDLLINMYDASEEPSYLIKNLLVTAGPVTMRYEICSPTMIAHPCVAHPTCPGIAGPNWSILSRNCTLIATTACSEIPLIATQMLPHFAIWTHVDVNKTFSKGHVKFWNNVTFKFTQLVFRLFNRMWNLWIEPGCTPQTWMLKFSDRTCCRTSQDEIDLRLPLLQKVTHTILGS